MKRVGKIQLHANPLEWYLYFEKNLRHFVCRMQLTYFFADNRSALFTLHTVCSTAVFLLSIAMWYTKLFMRTKDILALIDANIEQID